MNRSPLRWPTSGISQWDPDIYGKISWKTSQAPRLYSLWQKSINQALVVISEIIIAWAASCLSYELRNVDTIRRVRWYVAGKEWKIDNVEVKFITFIIQPGWKLVEIMPIPLLALIIASLTLKFNFESNIIPRWVCSSFLTTSDWLNMKGGLMGLYFW